MPTSRKQVRRIFAVVPAAGRSRRMGRAKLLLPLGGKTVIARLLDALDRPEIAARSVVARRDDEELAREVRTAGARLVRPDSAPPDMRTSVMHALDAVRREHAPQPDDGWLLAPADHPLIADETFDALFNRWRDTSALILIPTCQGRRGHPALFRWSLAEEIAKLPPDCGVNELLKRHADELEEIPVADPNVLTDLDTPQDYEALRQRFE